MCFIFHKWSKWKQYNYHYVLVPGFLAPTAIQGKQFGMTDLRQRRECLDCGKVQDVLVLENATVEEATITGQ